MTGCPYASRRGFLAGASTLAAAAAAGVPATAQVAHDKSDPARAVEPFHGAHQAGITTAQQRHTIAMAFDVTTTDRAALVDLLRRWTEAAARLAAGDEAQAADAGDAWGLKPARLTVTFGFGPSLFDHRFGLAPHRPAALVDMPRFNGDQLVAARSDGDLLVQACADDQEVAFHAVRTLAALAYGAADKRWVQNGFIAPPPDGGTPRNLMGFKDGTMNPAPADRAAMERFVWAGDEGPAWMRGGSYAVIRRIRMALEHWDRTPTDFQEDTMGRRKHSGAPLTGTGEFDPPDLARTDHDGNYVLAEGAHVRMAHPDRNGGAQILRRSYSYNDGLSFTAERWPPWRQGMEYDAGLLFVAWQRDPRTGFIRIFEPMSKLDMLNQFVTHTATATFAAPPGVKPGEYVGQALFES
jgi:deferrochelatase/peroxidase EfeB